jgi:hypothetical protein
MRTKIIAAAAAMCLASAVVADASEGEGGPVPNTQFTQIPGVVAQVPAGNVPPIDTAQRTSRSSRSPWLSPPIFTMPGMARR